MTNPYIIPDEATIWRARPNYVDSEVRTNSLGLRDREYETPKPNDTFRVLCLGDSCTWGLGVEPEETFHERLEAELNAQSGPTHGYEVINGGLIGYTITQCLEAYRSRWNELSPDLVILYTGRNDVFRWCAYTDRQIIDGDVPAEDDSLLGRTLGWSHFFQILRTVIESYTVRSTSPTASAVPRVSAEEYRQSLIELADSCERDGAELIVLSPPIRKEPPHRAFVLDEIAQRRRILEDTTRANDIALLTIDAMTERSANPTHQLFLDECHPNQQGHALIADRLLQFLHDRKPWLFRQAASRQSGSTYASD
jgi:lysophospholipase L1-like esterase